MAELVVTYDSVAGALVAKLVGASQIADGAITSGKLGAGAVISGSIASGIVGGPLLQDWGVLSGKVASGAIQPSDIAFLAGMISRPTPYGCVLDLDFNEGLGLKSYDKSGIGNDGSLLPDPGGPTWTDDPLMGKCLSFDYVNDYVNAGNKASLQFGTSDFSVAAWVKPATTFTQNVTNDHTVVSRNNADTDVAYTGWKLGWWRWVGWRFRLYDGTAYEATVAGNAASVWTHLVGVREGTAIRLYRDGVLVGETSSPTPVNVNGGLYNTIGIGVIIHFGTTNLFDGLIGEANIYNRALSVDEIRGRYVQGLAKLGKVQGSVRAFNSGWVQKMWFDPETADFQVVSGAIRTSGLIYAGTEQRQLTNVQGAIISGAIASGILGPHLASGGITSAHVGSGILVWPFFANASILSAAIASGVLGPHIASGGILSAHITSGLIGWPFTAAQGILSASIATNVLATPHFLNQGIFSASIGANVLATPHFANQGILSASFGANILATPHIQNQGILSASVGAAILATPHFLNQGILSASYGAATIGTPHIAANSVLSSLIASGQVGSFHLASGVQPQRIMYPNYVMSALVTHRSFYAVEEGVSGVADRLYWVGKTSGEVYAKVQVAIAQ